MDTILSNGNIFRLLLVSGASYADCDGVYTMTSMSSVWDTKHIVYTRIEARDQELKDNQQR